MNQTSGFYQQNDNPLLRQSQPSGPGGVFGGPGPMETPQSVKHSTLALGNFESQYK